MSRDRALRQVSYNGGVPIKFFFPHIQPILHHKRLSERCNRRRSDSLSYSFRQIPLRFHCNCIQVVFNSSAKDRRGSQKKGENPASYQLQLLKLLSKHLFASCWASAICCGVIFRETLSRFSMALLSPLAAAKLNHMCAFT